MTQILAAIVLSLIIGAGFGAAIRWPFLDREIERLRRDNEALLDAREREPVG